MTGRYASLAAATAAAVTLGVGVSSAQAAGMDISPESAPPAYLNQPYSATFNPRNATFPAAVTPFFIEWTSGSLPQGLSYEIASDGYHLTVSGTPTRIESTQFTLSGHDSSDKSGSRSYTLDVQLANTGGATAPLNGVIATVVTAVTKVLP